MRDSFYQSLLEETLYIPVLSDIPEGAAIYELPNEAPFSWAVAVVDGHPTVPCFTTQEKLMAFFAGIDGWERRWIASKGARLLKNMATFDGLCLEINPMSEFGVNLPPNRIKELAETVS